MLQIDTLRAQHDSALAMAERLLELVDNYQAGASAYPILMQFNRLFGLLRVHLAQEDVGLYAILGKSNDRHIARTAQQFAMEMGGLGASLETFARHWSCSASIAVRIDEFREEVHELVLALAVRIERENQFLYPLAEAARGTERQRDAA